MAIRLKDIAQAASVELSSVSRILRDDPRSLELRAETREKVKRIAQELGYHRNQSAAAMRRGVNDSTIALVCDAKSEDTPRLVFDAMTYLSTRQICVRCYTGSDLKDIFGEISANQIPWVINNMQHLESRQISAEFARHYGLKMVFTSQRQEFPDFPVCSNDDYAMMTSLVRYLHQFGHRRIVLIGGNTGHHISTAIRHQAFLDATSACGCPADASMIWHEEYDESGVKAFLSRNRPTAACTIDPFLAMKLSLLLERTGFSIPQDMSLISFGDSSNLTQYTVTPVTAINTHIGPQRIATMMSYFENGKLGEDASAFTRLFQAPITTRSSVAAPPSHKVPFTRLRPPSSP